MIYVFCGYDERESIGFAVFCHSLIVRSTQPLAIIPLSSRGLPEGTNSFTMSRFLVPYLMGYQGRAIFCDSSDMLMQGDIAELDALFDDRYAVQVVKHPDYKTRHKTKYRGTSMECPNSDYPRKNWASVMLMNCAHPAWSSATPERLASGKPVDMLKLEYCGDYIGSLPDEWNRLVDEGHPIEGAKILHWTAGIPAFEAYADAPGSYLWNKERMNLKRVG